MKPGLHWRPRDIGDVRAAEENCRLGVEPAQMKQVCRKAERNWRSEARFDIRCGDAEVAVCPVAFNLALAQFFLILPPFLLFGMARPILCHCMLEVCELLFNFNFTEGYS